MGRRFSRPPTLVSAPGQPAALLIGQGRILTADPMQPDSRLRLPATGRRTPGASGTSDPPTPLRPPRPVMTRGAAGINSGRNRLTTGWLFSTILSKTVPKVVDHEELRSHIRTAARRVFARRGLAGTGLKHVAREAGMGRASLYHYYPDKKSLLADLANELLREEEELFAKAASEGGSPAERIANVVAAVTELCGQWGSEGRLLLDLWASDMDRFAAALSAIRHDLAGVIADGQACGEIDSRLDPQAAAALVAGMIDGLM
ncbi:MAG: TetR/AcrR family transcriptional regulator, partial [Deltaproteobacteria bacterium]